MMSERTYIVGDISLPPSCGEALAFSSAGKKLNRAGIPTGQARFFIYRRSVDARKKNDVRFVYSVGVTGDLPPLSEEDLKKHGITEQKCGIPEVSPGNVPLPHRPVIVGAGPAGLFAALLLAENGYSPLVLERGGTVAERAAATELFTKRRILSTENNIQFGAGGAGTFSDGKLVTRVNDPLCGYVLRTFCRFGAPPEILTLAKPHIGTDYLQNVITRMIAEITRLGGEIRFHSRVSGIKRSADGKTVTALITPDGEIPCGAVILAIGNSARDTYETVIADGYAVEAKPFSVGVRIEHLQSDIDRAMFGKYAEGHGLPHAEYNLSCHTDTRGVYTFCMCPGGEVVAAASEEETVVVNGMSRHARDGRNANSAVAVSVFTEDYGNDPLRAIAMQREIERRAFLAGGGDYSVPVCTVGDFLSDRSGTHPSRILPTYMGGGAYRPASPACYLPRFAVDGLRSALPLFDRRIHGFAVADAVLSGAETRTSAPLRILRGEMRTAIGVYNLYPCGEGAGYAGGITSAALDGIHTAEALIRRYRPLGE